MKTKMKQGVPHCPLILTIVLLFPLFSSSCKKSSTDEFSVMTGYFRQSVIETGELEAIKANQITMPYINNQFGYRYKIIGMAEHGKVVSKGDSVVALDPSSIYKYLITRQEQLENEKAAASKQRVMMENSIQDLQAQLKNEQAAYNLKKLEMERIQYESASKQRIKELEFKQATLRLEKVKRNLESKPKLEELDLTIQKIKVKQGEADINSGLEALQRMVIHSPNNGIFQVAQNWNRQNIRLGDEVYIGSKIAGIPDISKMKALSYVGETDISKVSVGMKVIVRLDALPSVPFNGTVRYISLISTSKGNQKIFKTEIDIEESDLRLKPGMTVSCEYITYETDTAVFVPNSCVLKEGKHCYVVPDKGANSQRFEVTAGPSNSYHTLITSKIEPGMKLIPIEKADLQKIK